METGGHKESQKTPATKVYTIPINSSYVLRIMNKDIFQAKNTTGFQQMSQFLISFRFWRYHSQLQFLIFGRIPQKNADN